MSHGAVRFGWHLSHLLNGQQNGAKNGNPSITDPYFASSLKLIRYLSNPHKSRQTHQPNQMAEQPVAKKVAPPSPRSPRPNPTPRLSRLRASDPPPDPPAAWAARQRRPPPSDGSEKLAATVDGRNFAPFRNPGVLILLQKPANNGFNHGFKVVQDFVHPQ